MQDHTNVELLIVGAGLYGLIMAKTFLDVKPNARLQIIDGAESVGGTWAKERLYPGLKTNNVVGSYEFSDFPLDLRRYNLRHGDHIPGATLHQYFSDFAAHYDLFKHIQFRTRAVSAEQEDSGRWRVQTSSSSSSLTINTSGIIVADKLILATGLTSAPRPLSFSGQEDFEGPLFHARELPSRSSEIETAQRVVVIGGNKSAWDAAYNAAQQGSHVDLVVRPNGAGPTFAWPKIFPYGPWNLTIDHLASIRLLSAFDPSPFGPVKSLGWLKYFLHKTTIGQKLCNWYWKSIDRTVRRYHGYEDDPATIPLAPRTTPFWTGNAHSIHNYESNFFDLVRKGQIKVHLAEVSSISCRAVELSSGIRLETEAIVCCTGWRTGPSVPLRPDATGLVEEESNSTERAADLTEAFEFLRRETPALFREGRGGAGAAGAARTVEELTPQYQLFRSMVPWQRQYLGKRSIAFMGVATAVHHVLVGQLQALWITAFFEDTIQCLRPERVDYGAIRYDTVLQKVYQRIRRPREFGGVEGKYQEFVFDSQNYVDTILVDLGLNPKRKRSWLGEYLSIYSAADYKDIINEWRRL